MSKIEDQLPNSHPLFNVYKQLDKYANRTSYALGDSIESVAFREGQKELVHFLKTKVLKIRDHSTLPKQKET